MADLDGLALSLNGTGQVTVAMQPALNVSVVTLEAWVRPSALPATGRMGILDKDGQFGMFLYAPGVVRCTGGNGYVEGLSLAANAWVHVSCTYDGTTWVQYANGVQVANTSGASAPLTQGAVNGLVLGANSPNGDGFQGRLDRIRIWSVVRSVNAMCLESP